MHKIDDVTPEILTDSVDTAYAPSATWNLQQFSQPDLNYRVRNLGLSKIAAEILASRLQEKSLLKKIAKISYFRNWEKVFVEFFKA